MKVGIITFHWAANYGAVLQTYALQKAIENIGGEVEIIDYVPKSYTPKLWKVLWSRRVHDVKKKWTEYQKNYKISKDIAGKLKLSQHYANAGALKDCPPIYDLYITGSDQVWNEYFTLRGEGGITLSYYLDFVPQKRRKISYATSIGATQLSEKYWESVLPLLTEYEKIGVREQSAKAVLEERGLQATVLPDPTLLISPQEYGCIFKEMPSKFIYYILQDNQHSAQALKNHVNAKYAKDSSVNLNKVSLAEWGGYISRAECVLTNSYHGIIFSILNHRKFFAVLIEGELQGMNDRVITLLERLDLKERIVKTSEELDRAMQKNINWEKVDRLLEEYRSEGMSYLNSFLK